MALTLEHVTSVVNALIDDVVASLGCSADVATDAVLAEALSILSWMDDDLGDTFFAIKLGDDVQQYFHDRFVDTTWPACPDHPNHPLDFKGEPMTWTCPTTHESKCSLGNLGDVALPPVDAAAATALAVLVSSRRDELRRRWSDQRQRLGESA